MSSSMLRAAELAWYVTGRFYLATDRSVADYGYFLHLGGIAAPLFTGEISEATAHFTFAATPFQSKSIRNGALNLALDPIGEFAVYLQREPAGNFDEPATFKQGECIAVLRRISMVVGTTVETGNGATAQAMLTANVFSARLLESRPFEFGGAIYNPREILGAGVTQFGTAASAEIKPPPLGYTAVVPFTGSAIRLGAE